MNTSSKDSPFRLHLLILIVCLLSSAQSQLSAANKIHIQSRKYSAITGEQAQTKVTPQRAIQTIPYVRAFTRKPDVGLSVYNMQFDYNPEFSINVLQETSTLTNFQFYLTGRPSQSNIFNELYIMYIASDYDLLGIYMPGPKNTTAKIGISTTPGQKFEDITFNFKNVDNLPIFPAATKQSDIRVSVYLTGISALSQTVENGYEKNYAYFSLSVPNYNSRVYTIRVKVKSFYADVLIKIIEFTVVYFDVNKISAQYQMNSNVIVSSNFGGTFFKSSYSAPLQPLVEDANFDNTLQYFFGISQIECSQGQTINLLAVERFNYNNNGKLQNLVLTFQTQRNTFISRGTYSYIQYKPRNCNDPKTCGISCQKATQPVFKISQAQGLCYPCLYFCASCTNGTRCDSCPPLTRIPANNGICVCKNNSFFDRVDKIQCLDCFQVNYCETCQRQGVCLSCFSNFLFNNAKRVCQCMAGTYDSIDHKKNQTGLLKQINTICKACAPNCIYCKNATICQSCTTPTYLAKTPTVVKQILQTCYPMCNSLQQFDSFSKTCQQYNGDTGLFDSSGRLGFDWTYKNVNNDLVVDLLFSQANMTYYFYQNGKGYQYVKATVEETKRNDQGTSSLFYDDGNGYIRGYSGAGATSFQSSVINTKITQQANGFLFDQSALQGEYYGLGQARFYKERYQALQPQAGYFDQFGIPFGKHQLNSTTISSSATFLDAIRNNLQFNISGQSMSYTIRALSGNHFELTVRPERSYLTSNASITFKNAALVRSGETALQTPTVSKQLDRIDFYTQNQLMTASSLRDRTATIVQILWGICKYILFIGFGWAVMPLMLILQYIFGHNYITSQLPLNLKYFLTSFADFRNPSILFNPQRNQFDRSVVNHAQIYKRVGAYQEFDRGIDFMKNSFQFFFVPLLSFGLQFLFIGLNFLTTKVCKRQIPIISRYLQPRLGLHAAAYTLVQALPISFFFFGQLQDTRYNHVNSPNSIYPSFNTGMSYASFFASGIIPLILLTGIYNYFKNKARSGNFDFNKVKGVGNDESAPVSKDPAMIGDPLWGGNSYNPLSYGFGAAVFYLPLLAGFVLSFFTKSYPWQLTGLLLGNLGLTSFAAASPHFDTKIPKFFFVGIGALMTGYQLVHAGIGSNRALSTFDQWNTGYLGIGIIYAMLLAGIIFSAYLIYKLLTNLYRNIIKPYGCFSKVGQKQAVPQLQSPEQERGGTRFNTMTRKQKKEKTLLKSYLQNNMNSEDRLNLKNDNKEYEMGVLGGLNKNNYKQDLLLSSNLPNGNCIFKAQQSQKQYQFPFWSSNILKQNMPLLIDSEQKIYRKNNNELLGTAKQFLMAKNDSQNSGSKNAINIGGGRRNDESRSSQQGYINQNRRLNDAFNLIRSNNNLQGVSAANFIKINGQPYQYRESSDDEDFIVMNYKGKPQYKMTTEEFCEVFMNNQNTVNLNGEEYQLSKGQYEDDDQQFFFLSNNKGTQIKVTVEQFIQVLHESNKTKASKGQQKLKLATSNQLNQGYNLGINQAMNMNQQLNQIQGQGRILSTSLLPSNKMFSEKNYGEYVQFQPTSSNKSIMYTKENQQYLINGMRYEKVDENAEFLFLRNIQTNQRMSVRKQDVHIKGSYQQIKTGSIKQLAQRKLREQEGIIYQGQKYRYNGQQNNKYSFYNSTQNNYLYLTLQELAEFYGFNRAQASMVQVNTNINFKPPNAKTLVYIRFDKNKEAYIYCHPDDSETLYQMPVQWIDVNEDIYLDSKGKFWHKGQQMEGSESDSQEVPPQQYKVKTYESLPSSASISLGDGLSPNNYYIIKYLTPDYKHSVSKIPSAHEIQEIKQGIRGDNVIHIVEDIKKRNPYGKFFIENMNNPSQKYIME